MLATPAEFEDLWNAAIKQDLVDSEDKKLFVFVSTAEADSVCALHILQVSQPVHPATTLHSACWSAATADALSRAWCAGLCRGRGFSLAARVQYAGSPGCDLSKAREIRGPWETCDVRRGTIVQVLCKAEHVHYSLWPVESYEEMKAISTEEFEDDAVRPSYLCCTRFACHRVESVTLMQHQLQLPRPPAAKYLLVYAAGRAHGHADQLRRVRRHPGVPAAVAAGPPHCCGQPPPYSCQVLQSWLSRG